VGGCRRPPTRSGVKYRPADIVPQPLVVKHELANRLRELVTLPPALESPGALALPFRRASTCGLDRIGGRTEFVRGDVRDGPGLAGSVRGMPCRPAQVSGRGHGMAGCRASLGHLHLATHPGAGVLDRLTRSWVLRPGRLGGNSANRVAADVAYARLMNSRSASWSAEDPGQWPDARAVRHAAAAASGSWQAGFMAEQSLPGGLVTAVVRAGNTVRRTQPQNPEFVQAVLEWLERHGWDGAPRFLGTDELGREVLSFIDGHVAWEPAQPPSVTSEPSLARVAGLVREFHDLTAGTPLAAGAEVICHNDLSPSNTVYRDSGTGLEPMAFNRLGSGRSGPADSRYRPCVLAIPRPRPRCGRRGRGRPGDAAHM
jgi:hypothetical protein